MVAQFVDLCILCGCDYCPSIRGIGPTTALKLIKRHKDLEGVLKVGMTAQGSMAGRRQGARARGAGGAGFGEGHQWEGRGYGLVHR